MRVLLVCHGYPPDGVAGVERISAQTAEALAARGHEVTVLTRRPGEPPQALALERRREHGVAVVTVTGACSTFGAFPGFEERLEGVFERMLAEAPPDVVLLSHLLHHSAGYVEIAHRWRIPVAMELHDFYAACPLAHLQRVTGERCAGPEGGEACASACFAEQPCSLERWSLRARGFAHAVQHADLVVCPSRLVADYFAPMRGAAPLEVLGNGVAPLGPVLRAPRDAGGPLRLASIGIAIPHKGFHVVVEALRRAALPAAEYTILGDVARPYERELLDGAATIPGVRLRLFGRFEPAWLPVLLADVDAVVVPSIVAETYSVAAREALACGVPVLASRIGALPDAIRDGENGLLFEPGDAEGLARLLRRIAADRSLLERLAGGIRRADWITVEERTDRLVELLAATVRAGGRPPSPEAARLRALRERLAVAPDC